MTSPTVSSVVNLVPVPLIVVDVILIVPLATLGCTSITGFMLVINVLLPSAYSCSPMLIVASKLLPLKVPNLLLLSKAEKNNVPPCHILLSNESVNVSISVLILSSASSVVPVVNALDTFCVATSI